MCAVKKRNVAGFDTKDKMVDERVTEIIFLICIISLSSRIPDRSDFSTDLEARLRGPLGVMSFCGDFVSGQLLPAQPPGSEDQ